MKLGSASDTLLLKLVFQATLAGISRPDRGHENTSAILINFAEGEQVLQHAQGLLALKAGLGSP